MYPSKTNGQGIFLPHWNQNFPYCHSRDHPQSLLWRLCLWAVWLPRDWTGGKHRALSAGRVKWSQQLSDMGVDDGVLKNICLNKNVSTILDAQHLFNLKKKIKKACKECGKDLKQKGVHIFMSALLATFLRLFIMMFKTKNLWDYFKQAGRLIKLTTEAIAAVWEGKKQPL